MDVWFSFPLVEWTQGDTKRFFCPCCENIFCVQVKKIIAWPGALLLSLSSLESPGFLQDGSPPLHLDSHKYFPFSEIRQDTCLSQNISTVVLNSVISAEEAATFLFKLISETGMRFLFHPFLPGLCKGTVPAPQFCRTLQASFLSCLGNTCTAQEGVNLINTNPLLYFHHTPPMQS